MTQETQHGRCAGSRQGVAATRGPHTLLHVVLLMAAAFGLVACSDPGDCPPVDGVEFVCGPENAEDLVLVPGTDWIIASGLAPGAGFYLIDAASGEFSPLAAGVAADPLLYPDCDAPPPVTDFESHGLHLRSRSGGRASLSVVGHGAREAIEIYEVDTAAARPALNWQGCVLLPDGLAANSVASLADGSLVATVLLLPGRSFADSVAKRPTGAVLAWSPGAAGFTQLSGSELPGNNGIEVAADGSEIYVVSSGFQTIVAFSNTDPVRFLRATAQLPITPDNLHFGPDGRLLTAGMKNDVPECGGPPGPEHDLARLASCPRGTIAIAIDPATMLTEVLTETPALEAFSNATMALPVGERYWFGSFRGDRIANSE
jgi:hypothetical protein